LFEIDTLSFSQNRLLIFSGNITAGQLTDTYTDLTIGSFYKTDANKALEILIEWENTRTMSVDKIWVFDNYYEKLFYTDPSGSGTDISNKINSYLNSSTEFNNSNYYHLYLDEPAPLQNRSYDKVSSISSNLPNGKYMNATNWAFPESELAVQNYLRRSKYVSIDYYPFGGYTGYGTNEVQTCLDNLIAYPNYTGSTGGLRAAINWAHNFDNDPSNDIRFFHTIQVQAEASSVNGTDWVGTHRAPTTPEIFVQGYLAMCYGATGLIYYALHTTTDNNNKLWGLFDEVGNHFTGNYNQVQNKINAVEPNDRFYAVKELNRQIDLISPELLQLTWVNGYNIHKGESLAGNYISGITSYHIPELLNSSSFQDLPINTYVELGEFKKTSDFLNPNLDYFLLVNRRCDPSDFRHIVADFNITNSAYINWGIKDIGSGRLWTINKTGSLDDTLSPGTGKLYRLAPVVLYGGDLNYNETVDGPCTLTGDLTIKAGVTLIVAGTYNIQANITVESGGSLLVSGFAHLNIQAGSKLNFANNSGITVYGQLNADSATFQTNGSGTWGAIKFDGLNAAGSVLNNITIKQGDGIQCLNGADITIENSYLDSCFTGIYIYNSAPQIINDYIHNPQQDGIYSDAYNLSPVIKDNRIYKYPAQFSWIGIHIINGTYSFVSHNDVYGFGYGIYIGDGSTCYFDDIDYSSPVPNNRFWFNNTGMCAASGSMLWAGCDGGMPGNSNTIMANYVAAEQNDYGCLEAWYNYWGDTLHQPPVFVITNTGYFEWDNPLTDDPWDQQNSVKNKPVGQLASNISLTKNSLTNSAITNSTNSLTSSNGISTGLLLERSGRIDDAIIFYKDLIANNKYVRIALSQLAHIKYKYAKNDLANYFGNLLTSTPIHYAKIKKMYGDMYLQNKQFDQAIATYNDVIVNDSTGYYGISARFEKLFAYLHIKNDINTATTILSDIKNLNSNNVEVQMRIKIAENLINAANKGMEKKANLVTENVPKTYGLFQNFPNPFNPETTIRYQIPKPGLVTLKVYDILGREVATLVNENKIEGSYDFTFNASRFASGVYIYQLRVNDYVSSKKMILLK
jgi:tetratricopeptide (TPR) repeat protein